MTVDQGIARNGRVLRVCVLQQVIPAYRTPVFNLLGSREEIDLSVWAGVSSSGDPPADHLTATQHFRFREAPVRSIGPLLSQPAQLAALRRRFDVLVYSWNSRFIELIPALIGARHLGLGSVVWGHGVSPAETTLRRNVRDRVGALADACIVYNESVAARLRTMTGYAEKVFVAGNAIDLRPIDEAAEKWATQPERLGRFRAERSLQNTSIVLFLSRLRALKRADLAIEATQILLQQGRDVVLVLIGDGSDRARLEALAATLGISDRVLFLGAVYDESIIAAWALSAIACLVPGPVGLSLLHAFGYGLPVVTSEEPQSPEIEALRPGENGFLFPLNDRASMVDAISVLIDDPERRQRMSRAAAETVRGAGFTIANMVDGMAEAIRCAGRRASERVESVQPIPRRTT